MRHEVRPSGQQLFHTEQRERTQQGPGTLGARVDAYPRLPANRTGKPKAQRSLPLSQASGAGCAPRPSRCAPGADRVAQNQPRAQMHSSRERLRGPPRGPGPCRLPAPESKRPDPSGTASEANRITEGHPRRKESSLGLRMSFREMGRSGAAGLSEALPRTLANAPRAFLRICSRKSCVGLFISGIYDLT